MVDLRDRLTEYRDITVTLIKMAEKDEELQDTIALRGNILKEIENTDYNKQELKALIEELNIEELDEQLKLIIKKEIKSIRTQLDNVNKGREAVKCIRNTKQQPTFFVGRA